MLISYTLDAGSNRHNMDTLSEIHLQHVTNKELVGSGYALIQKSAPYKNPEYFAEDADVTLRLYEYLKNRLDQEKLNKIYEYFEKPMVKLLSKLEFNGIKVDVDHLKKLSKQFENKLKKIEKDIFAENTSILLHQNN